MSGTVHNSLEQRIEEIAAVISAADEERQVYAERLDRLEQEYREALAKGQENASASLSEHLAELDSMRDNVLKYKRIAESHTSKRVEPADAAPVKPDVPALKKKAFAVIDAAQKEDPAAVEILEACASYLSWLEQEKKNGAAGSGAMLDAIGAEFENKKAVIVRQAEDMLDQTCRRIRELDVAGAVHRVSERIRHWTMPDAFGETGPDFDGDETLIGFLETSVKQLPLVSDVLKEQFENWYDSENSRLRAPLLIPVSPCRPVFMTALSACENEISSMLQAWSLNLMQRFSPDEVRIQLLDTVYFNSRLLGDLAALSGAAGSPVETVPQNPDALRQRVENLTEQMQRAQEKLIGTSFGTYQREHLGTADALPYRFLIIHEDDGGSLGMTAQLAMILNNAAYVGIQIVWIRRVHPGSSDNGELWLKQCADRHPGSVLIRADGEGAFQIRLGERDAGFRFHVLSGPVPQTVLRSLCSGKEPDNKSTAYFEQYPFHLPKRSVSVRRPVEVPIGIEGSGKPLVINFEGVNFSTYIMGSAGSGKSTLLHTIIAGIAMNYHPDEVELWLADFNKVEFVTYMRHPLPHVRNILLDDSRELVFDLVDQLLAESKRRKQYLSSRGYQDINNLPPAEKMPAIMVIVDEFARMSDVLKHEPVYQDHLTELLQVGRKQGFKFIFASQNYNDGLHGLKDEAKNQIQNRIALMNPERNEITGVLAIPPDRMTDEINNWISELPAYHAIVKLTHKEKGFTVHRISNYYPSPSSDPLEGMRDLANRLYAAMKPTRDPMEQADDRYLEKACVYLDGNIPKTFTEQLPDIERYEEENRTELLPGDVRMYPGSPRGFRAVRSFELIPKPMQNILVTGGDTGTDPDAERVTASLIASLITSYRRAGGTVEVWSDDRDPVYYRYHHLWRGAAGISDEAEICGRIRELGSSDSGGKQSVLVVILGYESLLQTMAVAPDLRTALDAAAGSREEDSEKQNAADAYEGPDLSAIMQMEMNGEDVSAKIEVHNRHANEVNSRVKQAEEEKRAAAGTPVLYDAREDLNKLFMNGGRSGLHFVLCCPDSDMLDVLRVKTELFVHQILFRLPSSALRRFVGEQADYLNLTTGVGYYQKNRKGYSFRTHLYPGLPVGGYEADEEGHVREAFL